RPAALLEAVRRGAPTARRRGAADHDRTSAGRAGRRAGDPRHPDRAGERAAPPSRGSNARGVAAARSGVPHAHRERLAEPADVGDQHARLLLDLLDPGAVALHPLRAGGLLPRPPGEPGCDRRGQPRRGARGHGPTPRRRRGADAGPLRGRRSGGGPVTTELTPSAATDPSALVLQPLGDAPTSTYLPATPTTTTWGRLPCGEDAPALCVEPGATIVGDTVSHEGILEDQGRDPVAFFGSHGVAPGEVLLDAIAVAAHGHHDVTGGPHVVTGPIEVRGTRPGDLLSVRIDALAPRTPYGVISSRHGKGLLPGTFPADGPLTSVF